MFYTFLYGKKIVFGDTQKALLRCNFNTIFSSLGKFTVEQYCFAVYFPRLSESGPRRFRFLPSAFLLTTPLLLTAAFLLTATKVPLAALHPHPPCFTD